MTYFIIAENDSIGPLEAITKSKEMMRGNKWKYFCLGFRFFGWALLCILTLGIGLLWFLPYMIVSLAQFYDDLKENNRVTVEQKITIETKKCPSCAEEIKLEALVCRYCGHKFDETDIMRIKKSLQSQVSLKEKQNSLKKMHRTIRNSRIGGLFFTSFGTVFILLSIMIYFLNPKDGIWVPLIFILVFSPLVLGGILLFKKANKFKIDSMKLNSEVEELTHAIKVMQSA